MRELDLLLEKFLASDFDSIAEEELVSLERLLDHPDQDILAWISAVRQPPQQLHSIVSRIRRCLRD
jgi:succinate dehydrogenase flavin-adding protein (antitoxin of CptAB toxin-antitoxin module)